MHDIAGQREARALRDQWEQAFASTSRGISITDAASGIVQSVNPAFAAMHGGEVEDFVGLPSTALLPADWSERSEALVEQLDRDGHLHVAAEHVRLDGSVFPVAAEAITTYAEDGSARYRIAWIEDLTEARAVEAAFREANAMFEVAFMEAPMGVALIGMDGRFLRVNAALCEMLGRPEDEIVGSTSTPFTHPDDLTVTADAFRRLREDGASLPVEKRYLKPDGTVVWAATRGRSVRGDDGEPRYIVSHFNDVTATKLAQRTQAEATARFEAAFADAPIGMSLVGLDGRLMKVNRMLCERTGYSEAELIGRRVDEMIHPDDRDLDLDLVRQVLRGEIDRYTSEKRFYAVGGEMVLVKLAVSLIRDGDGDPAHFVVQLEDVSERRRLEASLKRLANRDPLTDLWNRRRFDEELDRQVDRCRRYGERAVLLLLDLDGFKPVNDLYGHATGDDLLKRIAVAMRERLRSTDSLARLGGDEFVALLVGVSPAEAGALTEQLRERIASVRVHVDGHAIGVTASVGASVIDARTASGHDAMLEADAAMYEVKAASADPRG